MECSVRDVLEDFRSNSILKMDDGLKMLENHIVISRLGYCIYKISFYMAYISIKTINVNGSRTLQRDL